MASKASIFMERVVRIIRVNEKLENDIASKRFGKISSKLPSKRSVKKYDIQEMDVYGRQMQVWNLKQDIKQPVIFYLHGGAFVHGLTTMHYRFIEKIIDASDCAIIVLDYSLLPQGHVDDIYPFLESCYLRGMAMSQNRKPT